MKRKANCFFYLIMIFFSCSLHAEQGTWSYKGTTGPANWGKLNKAFSLCTKGHMQSPINIQQPFKPAPFSLEIKYEYAPMLIVNEGSTKLIINHIAIDHQEEAIQLNFSEWGVKETLLFNGKAYHLREFHFHTPGETAMQGQITPMEIHFVHQSDDEHVAVLTVLVKEGAANPVLQNIVNHIPADHGVVHEIPGATVNPMGLMPAKQRYYYFLGSLTTPPCTEGLHWIVMSDTITASAAQIAAFKKAVDGNNARPIQPSNQRDIYYSG